MTARRASLTSPGALALLGVGLVLIFTLFLMQPQQRQRVIEAPWLRRAIHIVTPDSWSHGNTAQALPPFALRGTMVAADPAKSTAVFDLGNGRVHVLHPGSTLPGVGRLLEVVGDGVYLEVNGRRRQFTFGDSTLGSAVTRGSYGALAQESASQADFQYGAAGNPASRRGLQAERFIVPESMPQISDAPPGEPELNASPRPGQFIDTTVWD